MSTMNRGLPGADLLAVIAPHYPKVPAGAGRRPIGGERMLRIYFLQQWFALSDPRVEESQYDSRAMREWGGIDLGGEGAPDESLSATCWHASRHRHPCRCHDYPCVGLDQECKEAARPREASNQKSGQWYLGLPFWSSRRSSAGTKFATKAWRRMLTHLRSCVRWPIAIRPGAGLNDDSQVVSETRQKPRKTRALK